jgi:hypothetical protein
MALTYKLVGYDRETELLTTEHILPAASVGRAKIIAGWTVLKGCTCDQVFAKHEGQNYYLDLATHEDGRRPECLYERLCRGSSAEFPFLFQK